MNINVDFYGTKKTRSAIAKRPTVTAVNLSGKDLRQHERMMEFGHRMSQVSADFQSAMASLAVANQDIDRLQSENAKLKAEVERLQGALDNERRAGLKTELERIKNEHEKSAKPGKKGSKPPRPSAEAETAAAATAE